MLFVTKMGKGLSKGAKTIIRDTIKIVHSVKTQAKSAGCFWSVGRALNVILLAPRGLAERQTAGSRTSRNMPAIAQLPSWAPRLAARSESSPFSPGGSDGPSQGLSSVSIWRPMRLGMAGRSARRFSRRWPHPGEWNAWWSPIGRGRRSPVAPVGVVLELGEFNHMD